MVVGLFYIFLASFGCFEDLHLLKLRNGRVAKGFRLSVLCWECLAEFNNTETVWHVKYFIHIVYKLYALGKHTNPKIDYFTVIHIFFLKQVTFEVELEARRSSASTVWGSVPRQWRILLWWKRSPGSPPSCRSLVAYLPGTHEKCQCRLNLWTFSDVNSLSLFLSWTWGVLELAHTSGRKAKQETHHLIGHHRVDRTCPGPYRINILATDRVNKLQFYCIDIWSHRNSSDLETGASVLAYLMPPPGGDEGE